MLHDKPSVRLCQPSHSGRAGSPMPPAAAASRTRRCSRAATKPSTVPPAHAKQRRSAEARAFLEAPRGQRLSGTGAWRLGITETPTRSADRRVARPGIEHTRRTAGSHEWRQPESSLRTSRRARGRAWRRERAATSQQLVHFWRDRLYHNRRLLEGGLVIQMDGGCYLWVTLTNSEGRQRTTMRTLNRDADRDTILNAFTRAVLSTAEQDIYAWLLINDRQFEEMDRYFWHEIMDNDVTPDRRASFWVARAASLLLRGRPKESDQAFKEARRYDRDGSPTNFVWAAVLKMQGRIDEAIQKYEQVARRDPKLRPSMQHPRSDLLRPGRKGEGYPTFH